MAEMHELHWLRYEHADIGGVYRDHQEGGMSVWWQLRCWLRSKGSSPSSSSIEAQGPKGC